MRRHSAGGKHDKNEVVGKVPVAAGGAGEFRHYEDCFALSRSPGHGTAIREIREDSPCALML